MQPKLCSRCHKNVAVVFITKLDNNEPVNEGLCLKCARELGIKPVQDMMDRMGISEEDLEGLTSEMMSAFGGPEALEELMSASESEEEDDEGKTATFPYLGKLFSRNPPSDESRSEEVREESHSRKERKNGKKSKYLENYCISLTHKAQEGKLDEIIGREEEIARVVQILNRRQKNNPCLIGEPGVGKTAIAEALAQRIVAGKVPYKLRDKQVYLLDLTALVAGTQFRGQFESRMKGLIEEIRKMGNVILVIDEVHNIVGAGDAEGSMNAANILKPALSRGEIQVIGATTFAEYRKHIEKDAALERRFQPVTVAEPGIDDSVEILKGVRRYYEDFQDFMAMGPEQLEVLNVVNIRRPLAGTVEKIIDLQQQMEIHSHLKITGMINNTNLSTMTSADDLWDGYLVLREVADRTGIPVAYTTGKKEFLDDFLARNPDPAYVGTPVPIDVYMHRDWDSYIQHGLNTTDPRKEIY